VAFFGIQPELRSTREAVMAVARHMGQMARGSGSPEVLDELVSYAVAEGQAARAQLISEGRGREWKGFRKGLIRVGTFLDTTTFNRVYEPFIQKYFGD
jgi:hypothetical protein